jgi:hypothetical protein
MELNTVQITNFRSIEDSGVVPIERVASLVGKNESGKTNFLQALVHLNPAPGQPSAFDLNDDYPRRGLGDIEHSLKDPEFARPVVIRATYRLSDAEADELLAMFGQGAVKLGPNNTVEATVDYDMEKAWGFETDEAAVVKHISSQASVKGDPAKAKTIEELTAWARRTSVKRVLPRLAQCLPCSRTGVITTSTTRWSNGSPRANRCSSTSTSTRAWPARGTSVSS